MPDLSTLPRLAATVAVLWVAFSALLFAVAVIAVWFEKRKTGV